ncbi:MAG: tetratricopeptide repeat protein [Anaerolineae bacterium]|jgi:tetratricopeptide (TPR) repeat protein
MPELYPPLGILFAAPRPPLPSVIPARERIEALLDAADAQGESLQSRWIWAPTVQALADGLWGDELALCLDALVVRHQGAPAIAFADGDEMNAFPIEELGPMLARAGISLALLSLTPADDSDDALAQQVADALAAAGIHTLLWHDALSAEAVRRSAEALLAALLAGQTLQIALAEAQKGLNVQRPWRSNASSLPTPAHALSLHSPDPAQPLLTVTPTRESGVGKVVRFPGAGITAEWQRLPSEQEPGGLPAEPAHGMIGRSRELDMLEGFLRDEHAGSGALAVYGYEGLGKTSLVSHIARWLVRTGRFRRVVYTSMAGGGHRESALYDLGIRLIGDEFVQTPNVDEAVLQALADTPTLVIWDHVDALLPNGDFYPNSAALEALWQLGGRICATGRSRLCLIVDSPTLPRDIRLPTPLAHSLEIRPMPPDDAAALWSTLLHEADRNLQPEGDIADLPVLLGGHPLALGILAPIVVAGEMDVIATLEAMMPDLRRGEARLSNQALDVAMEVLLRSLDSDLRHAILPLGLFAGGMMEPQALRLLDIEEDRWAEIKGRFAAAHLVREERIPGLSAQYIRLHRASGRHLYQRMPSAFRSRIEPQFYGTYMGMMTWLSGMGSRSPEIVQMISRRELPNLRRALRLALQTQQLSMATTFARQLQGLLEQLGYAEESAAIDETIRRTTAELVPAEGPLSRAGVQFLLEQSEQLAAGGRMADSGRILQQLVERITREGGLSYGGAEAAQDQGTALHRFGRFLFAGGRADAALATYVRALRLLEKLDNIGPARRELVWLYEDMGQVYLAAMQMERAEHVLEKGLELAVAPDDSRAIGAIQMQLGLIAAARQDVDSARRRFEQALEQMETAQDLAGMATIWNQLGSLAWQLQDLDEAEKCYHRALEMAHKAEHVLMEAQSHMRLAQIAAHTGRSQVAQNHYAQAIRIYQEHDLQPALASAEAALAELLLHTGELQNARVHAEAARAVAESLGPAGRHWEACLLLQRIAEAEGDEEKIIHWRSRTHEAFAASPEAERVRESWGQLIEAVIKSCRGEAMDAETVELVESLEKNEEWEALAIAIWRILGGERGSDLYEYLDHIDALVIRTILQKLEGDE